MMKLYEYRVKADDEFRSFPAGFVVASSKDEARRGLLDLWFGEGIRPDHKFKIKLRKYTDEDSALVPLVMLPRIENAQTKPEHDVYAHKKRGSHYDYLNVATLQVEPGTVLQDMTKMAVYEDVLDHTWWVRPETEFHDGRFEKVS